MADPTPSSRCGKCGGGMMISDDMWKCPKCYVEPWTHETASKRIAELMKTVDVFADIVRERESRIAALEALLIAIHLDSEGNLYSSGSEEAWIRERDEALGGTDA